MKYIGIPLGMWVLFEKSFRKNLVSEFGYNKITAKQISKNAKSRYKSIIRNLPEFEKGDQFKTNIVGCAMLGAFVLSMPKRPSVDELTRTRGIWIFMNIRTAAAMRGDLQSAEFAC